MEGGDLIPDVLATLGGAISMSSDRLCTLEMEAGPRSEWEVLTDRTLAAGEASRGVQRGSKV